MASPNKPATSISVKAPSTVGSAPTAANAISQSFTNVSQQDLIQIISPNGGALVYRLDYQGNVFTVPSIGTPTPTALLSRRSGNSFASAFPQLNGNSADVLTISNGAIVFRIDSLGNAHTNS
ncbi:MAG TPA: hypothetical protein VN939_04090 [Chthoniobacterales bacterium]|jgi:hypothetical protein|nr:hypothetical protein [Chthoniobacterales bacterium]